MSEAPDALVAGAGPNGLAAAIEIARSGRSASGIEGHDENGGGTPRSPLIDEMVVRKRQEVIRNQ